MSGTQKMPMTLEELDGDGRSLTGERLFGMTVRAYVAESEFGGGHFATHWSTLPEHRNPVRLFTEADVASLVAKIDLIRKQRDALHNECSGHISDVARLVAALEKIANLRDSEGDEPFDEALDIADAALSQGQQP